MILTLTTSLSLHLNTLCRRLILLSWDYRTGIQYTKFYWPFGLQDLDLRKDVKVQSYQVSLSFIWPLAVSDPKNPIQTGATILAFHFHYLLQIFPTILLPASSHSVAKHRAHRDDIFASYNKRTVCLASKVRKSKEIKI